MGTYTILTIGAQTNSGLQVTLQNNNGSEKGFCALIKNSVTKQEVEVYPCKEGYSISEDSLPFLCQLPENCKSAKNLQSGNILTDAIANDNQ